MRDHFDPPGTAAGAAPANAGEAPQPHEASAPGTGLGTDDASQPAVRRLAVQRWPAAPSALMHDAGFDDIVEEVPVALVYNGISQAVMLASPLDLEDFAIGFSLSERIVGNPSDIFDMDVVHHANGLEVRLRIANQAMVALKQARRMRTGKTGCGLCGIDSLSEFNADAPPVRNPVNIAVAALHRAIEDLKRRQPLHAATGAVHAAGWADCDGELLLVREDVGRHNALDKLIGALARQNTAANGGFAVVTSRASFEMVQKAARAGIGILGAVSAPTAMAIRMAESAGLTLAGFVRRQQHVVYAHPHRLLAC